MKYFLLTVTETIDGYETTSQVPFAAKTDKSKAKKIHEILKDWRGEADNIDDDGYWFEGGCIKVIGFEREIPKSDYEVLIKY